VFFLFSAPLCVHLRVDSALNGYAATAFAYGQTGSGKTFTISGLQERIETIASDTGGTASDGLVPRSIRYLFDCISRARQSGGGVGDDGQTTFSVRASFAEIYNEQVYDLLNLQSGPLQVRWNVRNGFFVQDLFVVECENVDDVMAVVSEGHRNRRVGSHEMNMDSSRSHSLLTLHLESESIDPDDGHMMVKFGKMVFVDLAGSERLKESKATGMTMTETGAINKSLFTLGKVISALGKEAKKKSNDKNFVPYRDSKLTKLLMDSLGGSCMTLMIACCSPAESFLEETLSTLNYATRARNIQNRPMIQMDPKEQLIFNLRQEAKLLRLENEFLRQQLAAHNGGVIPPRLYSAPGSPGFNTNRGNSPSSNRSSNNSSGSPVSSPRQGSRRGGGSGRSRKSGGVSGGGSAPPPGLARNHSRGNGGNSMLPGISGGGGSSGGGPPGLNNSNSNLSSAAPSSPGRSNSEGRVMSPRTIRGGNNRSSSSSSSSNENENNTNTSSKNDAQMQKMLSTYKREIERLKTENREVRARGSVAERGTFVFLCDFMSLFLCF
jgi:hypothetical protein